jgi:hypothetical protein
VEKACFESDNGMERDMALVTEGFGRGNTPLGRKLCVGAYPDTRSINESAYLMPEKRRL